MSSSSTNTHHRKSSSLSTLSALSDDFTTDVKANMDNTIIDTAQYVRKAGYHLEAMGSDDRRLGDFPSSLDRIKVDPHKILKSMLQYAPTENGQRYVACAILACDQELDRQVDLANTWLRYLLLPVKANSDTRSDFEPSQSGTPTLEDTKQSITSVSAIRDKMFRNDIIFRDGFQCQVTGLYHLKVKRDLFPRVGLEAAHIVKRALAVFDRQQVECASVTWEIIRQYTHWSDKKLTTMMSLTDTPENGFMLQHDYHVAWDTLAWTLTPAMTSEEVPIPNTYCIEELHQLDVPPFPRKNIISFQDHSVTDEEYLTEEHKRDFTKPRYGVPLPNPELIALHCALAKVLHMSGAGDAIDLAMSRLFPEELPVKAMDADSLALQLSGLHLMETMGLNH